MPRIRHGPKVQPKHQVAGALPQARLDLGQVTEPAAYPFCLPFLRDGLDVAFEEAITIIVGENGTGKSTLLEGIAALAGFDEAGGGKGYRPLCGGRCQHQGLFILTSRNRRSRQRARSSS
jgi:hypothetical protein